ncbi:MAG TPA: DNA primase [Acidimicrobiales bacterium]|nr:DNA primase [Acidimicrobiales bacterium]
MAIPDEAVAQVRAATDLVSLAGEHVALRRQGRRWVGLCPFHSERTPSFTVNAEEGLYYCFGCQAAGDAISFIRAVEHLDFVEAVERLAERTGIPIHHEDAGDGRERKRRERLLAAVSAAVAWYHERLLHHADGGPAREYLRSRGYDASTVREFSLGWAPDDWDALARALEVPGPVLADAGLGFVNRRGRQQDAFRARVLFPIFDSGGRPVAFGGRVLPGRDGTGGPAGPKYKNSPETPIYSKRRTLYGLNWAKGDVVESGEAIVCEGYTDVIALFGIGLRRAVATCGTALGEDHFQMLRRFAQRVVLAYDADTAGQTAADRVYEWERRHEIDVAVATLPSGTDPAEMARTDPDALRQAIAGARPFLAFRLDRVLAEADLRSVEGRARAAESAMAVVAEHPSDLVRDQYVMNVADRCRIDPDRLRARLHELRRERARAATSAGRRAAPSGSGRAVARNGGDGAPENGTPRDPATRHRPSAPSAPDQDRAGVEALRLAVHRPDEVADRLEAVLFSNPVQRAAFEALAASTTLHEAIAGADPAVAALLERLAVEETEDSVDDVVTRLVDQAACRALADLESQARSSDAPLELAALTGWLRLKIEELRQPDAAVEAVNGLLPWLVESAREDA